MNRSDNRILTTHIGSLPRSLELLDADPATLKQAVDEIVARQVDTGIDVITDGELSKPSFITYINDRVDGITVHHHTAEEPDAFWMRTREAEMFPEYYEQLTKDLSGAAATFEGDVETLGPLRYTGHKLLQRDIDNLKAAAAKAGAPAENLFMPSTSVTEVEGIFRNSYYSTEEEHLYAIAEVMHEEYKTIVEAGLLLQVDDPTLVTHWILAPNESLADTRRWAQLRVDALNHALRGIPEERVRYHTCYSVDMGPRVHDLELKDIVDIILNINAGAYSFEAANPRHEHEWRVWKEAKLPDNKILIPGTITHSTVVVEHPDLVAERIIRFANVVGRDRVIAGADCGFSSIAGAAGVHASIVWAKLAALVEGARRASEQLWA
ncbi:MAG TPA: cobalamin-independent methionine synthase II family protein [Solirubrobacteraceae bacterium]|nr:cobalamin-independent methionine synthase II family protein [Solirubrobacteraceae bacterium]